MNSTEQGIGAALRATLLRRNLRESQSLLRDPFSNTPLLRAALAPPQRSSLPSRKRSHTSSQQCATGSMPASALAGVAAATDAHRPPHTDQQPGGSPSAGVTPPSYGASQRVPAPAAEGLSDDAISILTGLRKTLRATSVSEEARASKCAHGLQQLLAYSELADMRLACEAIEASSLPDEGLLCACQAAASPDVSARVAACFASSMLLPRLANLEQPASRTLFSALLLMLKQHARPVLESLITPALFANAGQLSSAQVEALTRLLKELPQALLGKALADFLQGDAAAGPAPWTEQQVAVLQAVAQRKPSLESATLAELLVQADANVDALRKSLKFSNLLNTLVRSHGPQLKPHLPEVRRVAERLDTFQKKTILAALVKLAESSGNN